MSPTHSHSKMVKPWVGTSSPKGWCRINVPCGNPGEVDGGLMLVTTGGNGVLVGVAVVVPVAVGLGVGVLGVERT